MGKEGAFLGRGFRCGKGFGFSHSLENEEGCGLYWISGRLFDLLVADSSSWLSGEDWKDGAGGFKFG